MSIEFSKSFYTHSIGPSEAFAFKEGQIVITADDGDVPQEVVRRIFTEMRDVQQWRPIVAYHMKKWEEAKEPHWSHAIYNFMRLFEQLQKIKPLPFPTSFFDECQCYYDKPPILSRRDFLDSTPADFTYVVEGKEFPCHTAILMLYPYWRTAFSGSYREERRVILHDTDVQAFKYFLNYLYDHQIPLVRPELTGIWDILRQLSQERTLLLQILILADRFLVQDLKEPVLFLLQENDKALSCLQQEQVLPAYRAAGFPAPEWPLNLGEEKLVFYVGDRKIEISKMLLFTRSVYFRRLIEQSGTNEVFLDPDIPFECYEFLLLQRQVMAIGKFLAAVTPENIFKILPIAVLELRGLEGTLCEMLCEWILKKKVERASLIAHDELIAIVVIDSHWDAALLQALPLTQVLKVIIRDELKKIDPDFLVRISSGKLIELYIPDTPMDFETLVRLKELLPHLQILELNAKKLTDNALIEIAKLPITELVLRNCVRITDVSPLASCPTLQRLALMKVTKSSEHTFLQLARRKNNWDSLSFIDCPPLSEETQAAFVNPHLREFKISNKNVSIDALLRREPCLNGLEVVAVDHAIQSLHQLDRLSYLRTLSLNADIPGAVIESALATLPLLRELCLYLFSAHNIFGRIRTKFLTEVELHGMNPTTPLDLRLLLEKNRSLALIILHQCEVNAEELRLIAKLQRLFRLEFHDVGGASAHVACLNGIRPLEHMEFCRSIEITPEFCALLATQKELYSFVYCQPLAVIMSLRNVLPFRDLQELILMGRLTDEDRAFIEKQAVRAKRLVLADYS